MRTCTRYFSPEYGSIGKNWLPRAPPNAARPHPMANVTEKTRGTLMPTHRAIRGLSTDAPHLAPKRGSSQAEPQAESHCGTRPDEEGAVHGQAQWADVPVALKGGWHWHGLQLG